MASFSETFGSPGAPGGSPLPVLGFGLAILAAIAIAIPPVREKAIPLALFLSPLWMPIPLAVTAWRQWILFRQSAFIASQEYILLEIKPPRSHAKTPLAMEAVLSGMHLSPGESTWWARSIQGKVRPWWSFEIASIDGQVHFFVWTRAPFRRNLEAQLYAQYPGLQVVDAPDYTRMISAKPTEWGIWGCDFDHTKADPYPIRTYVDYGLDKPTKEYEQVDPLSNMLEFLSTFGPGEQVWLQFIVRVHKGEKYHKKKPDGSAFTWKDEAKEIIKDIRSATVGKQTYTDVFTGEKRETEGFPNPTKGESEAMAAIERNVSKQAFDVGARAVYLAHPDRFSGTAIPGIVGLFKQFSSEGFNGFKPARWMTVYNDYPWELFVEDRKNRTRRRVVDAYRRRQYYYAPYKTDKHMVMSTEELATLYHVPSGSVETPALSRVQSATSTAPANLPT